MIKGILQIINSKRDRYGNCYWAFQYTDTKSGNAVRGAISGADSNILAAMRYVPCEGLELHYTTKEVGCREFDRLTKDWPYAGCTPEELAKWINKELAACTSYESWVKSQGTQDTNPYDDLINS